jgi:hypothetical protein
VNGGSIVKALAGLRMAIGTAAWVSPRMAGKAFGLDADENPQSPYLARLFGARDVALGWGALRSEGETRRQWLLAGSPATSPTSPRASSAGAADTSRS